VMEQSPHVMMVGEGAEAFAVSKGVGLVDPKYFYTEERWQQLQRQKEAEKNPPPKKSRLEKEVRPFGDHEFGTVGAACLDRAGNPATPFNTSGMYRGWVGADGQPRVLIYKD